jgi:TATA-binding protein-associated factor
LTVAEKQDASADDGTMNSDRDATAGDICRLAENAASAGTQDESTGNIRDKILVASTKNRKSTIQNTLPTRSSARISDQNESNNSNTTGVSGSVAQSLNKSNRGNSIHRCLIFAQHTSVLDIVETCVMQKYFPDINYSRLDGSVDPNKRGEIAKKFDDQKNNSTTDDIRILLMTTRACGLGLNLTAADTVIFVEHDWNPYVDMQAMDRAHRIGQTKPVMVYRLLAESTIEARLINIQELKQTIVDELINNSNEMSSASNSSNELGKSLWSSISSLVDNESVRSTDDINRIDYEAMNIESFLKSVSNTN